MKTWQKGCITILFVIMISVVSFVLYFIGSTQNSYVKVQPTKVIPAQQPTSVPLCDEATISAWMNRTASRTTELNNDLDALIEANSYDPKDFVRYANRAQTRYNAQKLEQVPECLRSLQLEVVDAFYYNYKSLSLWVSGDREESALYMEKMENQFDLIAAALESAKNLAE